MVGDRVGLRGFTPALIEGVEGAAVGNFEATNTADGMLLGEVEGAAEGEHVGDLVTVGLLDGTGVGAHDGCRVGLDVVGRLVLGKEVGFVDGREEVLKEGAFVRCVGMRVDGEVVVDRTGFNDGNLEGEYFIGLFVLNDGRMDGLRVLFGGSVGWIVGLLVYPFGSSHTRGKELGCGCLQ